ncbi:MAG: recombinase RecT, partial [Synergistaceae bacterium]|nr:recombinase RecT [Synergistaceae bacterium]
MEKDISDQVFNRLHELEATGQLIFPPNYAVGNALKSAYLILQETKDKDGRPVLETCTKTSIANSLLDMVIQGLNPVKKQCYFIPFG